MSDLGDDVLYGAKEIAKWLFKDERCAKRVYRATGNCGEGGPFFRFNGTICARKSTLIAWIEDQEKAALEKSNAVRPGVGQT